MLVFCFHEPILQKEIFLCVLSLFLRNGLHDTGSELTEANGIYQVGSVSSQESQEGSHPPHS